MEDLTDNEREEQLRRWWSENWLWIVGGIALGLAMLWGWQYWQQRKTQAAQADQAAYVAVITALDQNKFDEALKQAQALRAEHPTSPYADQADLAMGRAGVESRKFDEAAARLQVVADGSKDPELRAVAKSRLARVRIEQAKPDEALALLDVATAGSFAALYHDLRGDALAVKGDAAGARSEYDAALAAAKDANDLQLDVAFVELKRNALPASSGTAAPAAPAAAAPAAPPAAAAPAPAAGGPGK